MHAILMMAAAHLSYEYPQEEELKTAELEHLAGATAGLRENLSLGINPGNSDTVFPVCILLFNQTWASFERTNDVDNELLPSIDAASLVHLGAGFKRFVADPSTAFDISQLQIFDQVPIYSPKVELTEFIKDSNLPFEFEDEFRAEYLRIWPEDSGLNAARLEVYLTECKRLTLVLSVLELEKRKLDIRSLDEAVVRYLFTWPMFVSTEFLELMKQDADCVPLLFWHFYTTVQASIVGTYWWAQRRTNLMVKALGSRLREGGVEPRNMCGE